MSTQTRTSSLRAVRPLPPAADIHLFDHLVGRHLQTLGHAESKHLGSREVDHKLDAWRGLIPGERLRDLACDPFRGRICCDIDPDKVSAGQPDDDEDIEQVKANGRNPARWLRAGSSG